MKTTTYSSETDPAPGESLEELAVAMAGVGRTTPSVRHRNKHRLLESGLLLVLAVVLALVTVKGLGMGMSAVFTPIANAL
jgi:hypothetical protein